MFENSPRKYSLLLMVFALFICQFHVKLLAVTMAEKDLTNVASFVQPRVSLKLDFGAGCGLEVLVNDIPVTPQSFNHGGPSNLYMPISHFLVPGVNTVTLLAWRSDEFYLDEPDQGKCSLSLVAWDKKNMRPDFKEAIVIGQATLSLHDAYQHTNLEKSVQEGWLDDDDIKKMVTGELSGDKRKGLSTTKVDFNFNRKDGFTLKRNFQLNIPVYRSK